MKVSKGVLFDLTKPFHACISSYQPDCNDDSFEKKAFLRKYLKEIYY